MGRVRTGALSGVVICGVVFALSAPSCASATQIVVDVETDQTLCDSIDVGIAVGTPDQIDTKELQVFQDECFSGTSQVGALTITPSGSKSAVVGLRIVAGVNGKKAEVCGRPGSDGKPSWENCIVARRTVQFAPGQTTPLTVVLSADCVGQLCANGQECNLGKCVEPSQVQNDGGNKPPSEAGASDAPHDAPVDVIPGDSGVDACAFCKAPVGGSAQCDGVANTCTVDCSTSNCKEEVVCSAGLNCTIACGVGADCSNTRCVTTGTCAFTCAGNGAKPNCEGIDCHATQCTVNCDGIESECANITLDAGSSVVTCGVAAGGRAACNGVTCGGGICARSCGLGGLGCTGPSNCTGECSQWQDAGDGGL